MGKKKKKKKFSPTGNRTRVFRVTGGDTYHYTIEDYIHKTVLYYLLIRTVVALEEEWVLAEQFSPQHQHTYGESKRNPAAGMHYSNFTVTYTHSASWYLMQVLDSNGLLKG